MARRVVKTKGEKRGAGTMKDLKYERWLEGQGVKWQYDPAIALGRFLIKEGLSNKARLGKALSPEVVETYALAMIEGAEFPALIGEETPKGIFPLNGNHRLAAAKEAEKEFFDCYLVTPSTPYVRERMIRSANRIEGQPLSTEDAMIHAMYMVKTFGIEVKKAASDFGVTYSKLVAEVRVARAFDRALDAGVDAKKIHRSHLKMMESIKDDEVFAEAAKLVRKTGLPQSQVQQLVNDINHERKQAEQIKVVRKWAELPEVQVDVEKTRGGTSPMHQPQRTRFLRLLRGLDKHLERFPTSVSLGILSRDDVEEVRKIGDATIKRLIRVMREGENEFARQPKAVALGRAVALTPQDGVASQAAYPA